MSVVKKEIRTADYRTLETGVSMQHAQMGFKTDCHRVYTIRVTKTSLSALDTKRYIKKEALHMVIIGCDLCAFLPGTYAADVIFLADYAGVNAGRTCILTLQQVNSRYVYARSLTKPTSAKTARHSRGKY